MKDKSTHDLKILSYRLWEKREIIDAEIKEIDDLLHEREMLEAREIKQITKDLARTINDEDIGFTR